MTLWRDTTYRWAKSKVSWNHSKNGKQNDTEQEEGRTKQMIVEMQLHMKKEEDKAMKSDCNALKVKLTKLVITRFNGTHMNWFRFWNQFENEIDRSELYAVSKFSYLKELVSSKVGVIIDRLPFTSEGYTRTKNILISKYVKSSEVANVTFKT